MNFDKKYELILIGSGLSSLYFAKNYLKKKKSIHIISPKKIIGKNQEVNNHVYQYLPPQMISEKKKVNDFFISNKLEVNENCKIFGSLEFGGLSNYWALQIDSNIKQDLSHLSFKTKKDIQKEFKDLFLKNKFNYFSSGEKLKFLEIFQKDKNIAVDYPLLGFFNKKIKDLNFDNLNEQKDKIIPKNFYSNYLKNKKIFFHDFFVEKIRKKQNLIHIYCNNNKKKKIFKAKKIVLGCGTIATSRLVADFLNLKKEIKIYHHPRLYSLYISKNKWINNLSFQPSVMHLKQNKNQSLFTADFRPGNKVIIDALVKLNWFLKPFKPILNFFRQHLIFSNIFLNSKYSNLYMKKKNNSWYEVYSKNLNLGNVFKKTSKSIFDYLISQKKILPFKVNRFPGFGVDFHYFGTIQIKKKSKLSVNENCQLKNHKNIYIIDGSVFNFKKNKYPLGIILANAARIAKAVRKNV